MEITPEVKRIRRTWYSKDYTGQFRGRTVPASWQEQLESLQRGLAAHRQQGRDDLVAAGERMIADLLAQDPAEFNRRRGLIP